MTTTLNYILFTLGLIIYSVFDSGFYNKKIDKCHCVCTDVYNFAQEYIKCSTDSFIIALKDNTYNDG